MPRNSSNPLFDFEKLAFELKEKLSLVLHNEPSCRYIVTQDLDTRGTYVGIYNCVNCTFLPHPLLPCFYSSTMIHTYM